MGTVAGEVVEVRPPLNEAALDQLTPQDKLLLVMADSLRKLDGAVAEIQVALRQIQRDVDVDRRLTRLEATAARQSDVPSGS